VWSAAPPARSLYVLRSPLVTPRATPLLATMDFKLATSRRPARAVGYPAQGRGADGDGGGTAGTPPVGEGAIGVSNSQLCEIPLLTVSQRSAGRTKSNPRPNPTAGSCSGPNKRVGARSDGSEPTPSAVSPDPPDPTDIPLINRTFRIATWNMNGQSRLGASGASERKLPFAERLLHVENLDILVLTESHTEALDVSRSTNVLCQTGLATAKAGLAVLAKNNGEWYSTREEILIPGYAALTRLNHRRSVESFWLLAVYADTSDSYASLLVFYKLLYTKLSGFIQTLPLGAWQGCVTAGDWNFVEHDGDRFPFRDRPSKLTHIRTAFKDLARCCKMVDSAGPAPAPRLWSYSKMTASGKTFSRLDRIYLPDQGWATSGSDVLGTNWSDHRVVVATVMVMSPRVQRAVPAPRLPGLPLLDRSKTFWPNVLRDWEAMVNLPSITLESWTDFKRSTLAAGMSARNHTKKDGRKDWVSALRREKILPEEALSAATKALHDLRLKERNHGRPNVVWPTAVPRFDTPPAARRLAREASRDSPWTLPVQVTQHGGTPPFSHVAGKASGVDAPQRKVADLLDDRMAVMEKATRRKKKRMADKRTSEWFKQSSNKEADERGSRASVSVEGLRAPGDAFATTDLVGMTAIAKAYFLGLHTPEALPRDRLNEQASLLREVKASYEHLPGPPEFCSGPYTSEEVMALKKKMPSTALGPDGIPYYFWKELARRLDAQADSKTPLPLFWPVFQDLTEDVRTRGTSHLGFKDANISLFYKKGDPTLVSNYRPISSMNTDCKMYTNLVNGRLAPWAVSKLHEDQKSFVPGRLMSDHTRLATEVAHLCDSTGTNGFIVGLDQAKAYDRVDQKWLLSVLRAMGIPQPLINDIRDILPTCRSRVRVNSGLSEPFFLRRGVRQGDPLSCLLFNFSIEPLAMRLRVAIQGISVLGLPPAKIMLYADDTNLFLSPADSLPTVATCLTSTSYAIGSQFNLDKTDVKPVGTPAFKQLAYDDPVAIRASLPGAYVLHPSAPLRILGMWIGSEDFAAPRWAQIEAHIGKIIRQWRAIGASLRNRAVLASALLSSRCYHLLDGNGIPAATLSRISGKISRFVRGGFSLMPYTSLESPIREGGLGCPSFRSRKMAYDLRFLSQLITGPQKPLWKRWVWADLRSASSSTRRGDIGNLNPLLQRSHTKVSLLSDRLRQAFTTARKVGLDVECKFPSQAARDGAPATYHAAILKQSSQSSGCLKSHGVRNMGSVFSPPLTAMSCEVCKKVIALLQRNMSASAWSPLSTFGACEIPPEECSEIPAPVIWPAMNGPLGCIRILTVPVSIVATDDQIRAAQKGRGRAHLIPYPKKLRPVRSCAGPLAWPSVVHAWTDGSALDNGRDKCTAGAAWTTPLGLSDKVSLGGIRLTNNVAEVAAVVLCLLAWRQVDLVVHTDSSLVLGLTRGRLLAMERDGWIDIPRDRDAESLTGLYKHLLFLLRDRAGSVRFLKAKAHGNDVYNNEADLLANEGRRSGRLFDLTSLVTPSGWIDDCPVLAHQPVDVLTQMVVRASTVAPILRHTFSTFSDRWTVSIATSFGVLLNPSRYAVGVWKLTIPVGFKETIWREMNSGQAIGRHFFGKQDSGWQCSCGIVLSMDHILLGCAAYDLTVLQEVLVDALRTHTPPLFLKSLRPLDWHPSPWYPLIALSGLEDVPIKATKECLKPSKALSDSRPKREWIIGSYLWQIWKWRMKDIHEAGFTFVPRRHIESLSKVLLEPY